MTDLTTVGTQLMDVARDIDWSVHGEHLAAVDTEREVLAQKINQVVAFRNLLVVLDQLLEHGMSAGKISPDSDTVHKFIESAGGWADNARAVLAEAEAFAHKGYPVQNIHRLREISGDRDNPLFPLFISTLLSESIGLTSKDESLKEHTLDPEMLRKAAEIGRPYRHLGNE